MPATITSEFSTSPVELIMATVCKICADPKEPTLSLRRLPGPGPHRGGAGRVRLWTLRRPAGPRAPGPPRYGSWPIWGEAHCPGGRSIFLPRRQTQTPHSPISFPEDCFRPPAYIEEFVSFGQEEGDDSMSMSASEREDWAGSKPDQTDKPPRGALEGSV